MDFKGLVIIAVGLYALAASIFQWEWFFNNRKAQRLVNLISYKGARIFYGALGVAITVCGVVLLVNP